MNSTDSCDRLNVACDHQSWSWRAKFLCWLVIAITIVVATCLTGCGTAHHFIPAQPLERGHWQIAVSWHYNLNGLTGFGSAIWPDVFGYYGVSDEVVMGTGTVVFLPTYLSLAQYNESSPGEFWILWGHARLFGMNDNPFIETGLGYSKAYGGTQSLVQAGIGFGSNPKWLVGPTSLDGKLRWSLKYGLVGHDVGLNISHYHGTTKRAWITFFPSWPPSEDTVVAFPPGAVTDIVELEPTLYGDRWGIILETGDTVLMHEPVRHGFIFESPVSSWTRCLGESLRAVRIEMAEPDGALVDVERLQRDARAGAAVVICRAPQSFVDHVERISSWIEDNSIGWAIFDWPH